MSSMPINGDINSVLSQIRALRSQSPDVASAAQGTAGVDRAQAAGDTRFADVVTGALDAVNATQQASSELKTRFQMGDPSVDLAQVMLASGKSKVSFTALSEVRNRLVSAYQDVMNMPI